MDPTHQGLQSVDIKILYAKRVIEKCRDSYNECQQL